MGPQDPGVGRADELNQIELAGNAVEIDVVREIHLRVRHRGGRPGFRERDVSELHPAMAVGLINDIVLAGLIRGDEYGPGRRVGAARSGGRRHDFA